MEKKDKKTLLKIAIKFVYLCSEYTPPHVKTSSVNYKVAQAALAINDLAKAVK